MVRQGDPALIDDTVARELLASRTLARLAKDPRDRYDSCRALVDSTSAAIDRAGA